MKSFSYPSVNHPTCPFSSTHVPLSLSNFHPNKRAPEKVKDSRCSSPLHIPLSFHPTLLHFTLQYCFRYSINLKGITELILFTICFNNTIRGRARTLPQRATTKGWNGGTAERRQQSQANCNTKRKATQKTWIASAQLRGSPVIHSHSAN